jgi:hypothetical protein
MWLVRSGGIQRLDKSAGRGADLRPLGTDDQPAHVLGIVHRNLRQRIAFVWAELED